jgi:hypothetical protein
MAQTQDDLSNVDDAWDDDPAGAPAAHASPANVAPDPDDLDDGWGEAPAAGAASGRGQPTPIIGKRQRRELEKQQRRHAQQRKLEGKRERKEARRDEARQRVEQRPAAPAKVEAKPATKPKREPTASRALEAPSKIKGSGPKIQDVEPISRAQEEPEPDEARSPAQVTARPKRKPDAIVMYALYGVLAVVAVIALVKLL